MTPHITDHELPGRDGVRVLVRLDISPEEHVLIFKYRMGADAIDFPAYYQGRKLVFGDFYGRTHATIWDIDSPHQARKFIEGLRLGFKAFETFLESNRKSVQYEPPQLPWNYFETSRFEHAWIKGDTGWGKTSLLSAMIVEDLRKVWAGKASVIVIDSQDHHLGHFLPRLPIHPDIIYLEPDLDHPWAMNILDFKGYDQLSNNQRFERLQTIRDMLLFFFGATVDMPSGHMRNIVGFALRALALMEKPTIATFKELLIEGRMKNLPRHHPRLKELDDQAKQFLLTDLFKQTYGQSTPALASRLDAFLENEFVAACFSQPENRFDLYDLLKSPQFIVINLNKSMLREHQSLMGRYFLALLLGVVNTRSKGGLPCYVYCDEAHLFIKDEPVVADLIATARRQNISFTFSHQWPSQVGTTAKALEHCGIQINPGKKKYQWAVQVNRGDVHLVDPPFVDFSKIDGMPPDQWAVIMEKMHKRFSVGTRPKPEPDDMPDAV